MVILSILWSRLLKKTLSLLKNKEMARQMGANGKEHVRNNFLIISQLRDNLAYLMNY